MSNDTPPPSGFSPIADPLGDPVATSAAPAGYHPIQDPIGDPDATADPNYVPPTVGGGNSWGDVAKGAPQAIASGFNRGMLNLAGVPMNAATDVANLVKAGAGYVDSKITGKAPPAWSEPSDPANVVGTSAWLNKEAARPFGGSIVNLTGDPQSYILQSLHATTEQTGPNALLPGSEEFGRQTAPIEKEVSSERAPTAEENLAAQTAASRGNMGAAVAPPSLAGTSPGLRQAVANAKNINQDALARHIDAETLPMPEGETPAPLRKGQATRDDQQISDEINMRSDPDTQGILAHSIDAQNKTLGLSMGEIRRRATPTVVGRTTAEHGQAAIDAIRAQDNAAVSDIRAKYGALADAAGGVMPLDTGTAADEIDAQLAAKLKTKVANGDPTISDVMERLRSGEPMTFDTYNNAISNLAEVQRSHTPASVASGIVRNHLESMPLPEKWAQLKSLRDQASSAAKARFDTIDRNPAYAAVVDDNVARTPNGLHVIGAPSPLADKFMDTYFLGNGPNAARAYVQRIKGVMAANPDFSQAVEASALNKLRDSAGLDQFDTGNFAHANFRKTWKSLAPKSDVLMSPETIDNVEHLGRYSDDVNYAGKSSSINRSNTALTLQRFGAKAPPSVKQPTVPGELAGHAIDVAAAHAGPLAYGAKRVGSILWKGAQEAKAAAAKQAAEESVRAAKLKFAQDATAPGAGIDMGVPPPAPAAGSRATGGRVDHEILVSGLMDRWHAARKASKKATEPLLNLPDETISKALDIAATPRPDVVRQLAGGA